jgi:lysophospholipase L1-like esterase
VPQQIDRYLYGHSPAANDLFAVWAGSNDLFDSLTRLAANPTPTNISRSAAASADTLVGVGAFAPRGTDSVRTLINRGARQFVVNTLPPLGETPYFRSLNSLIEGTSALADGWTSAFNAELSADLAALKLANPGVKVVTVDTNSLFQQISQPNNLFGFTDWTTPAGPYANFPDSVFISAVTEPDASTHLFFDGVHPTSKAQQIFGLEAAAGVYAALGINNLVVTSTADTVDPLASGLSLREMLNLANALPGRQTITFNLGSGPHEIQLGGQDLALTDDLILRGPANGSLSISGAGQSRIFEVAAGAHVTISQLTLDNGVADRGGAISNAGQLELDDAALIANTAQIGGAIYNSGTLRVNGSLLSFKPPRSAHSTRAVPWPTTGPPPAPRSSGR